MKYIYSLLLAFLFVVKASETNAGLPDTVEKIEPSIVGIATYSRTSRPTTRLMGTGFVILNGQYVATNEHVVPDYLNPEIKEKLVVLVGKGRRPQVRNAEVVAVDVTHDLAILKISGRKLTPFNWYENKVRSGQSVAFTGFPIGAVLGLYPVTHQGIVSAITPIVIPARSSKELTIKQLKQLKDPYMVYQLDATAYPGNSGSPVYSPETGEILAIINKVLVKSTKESVLSDPSAITYAIPVRYLKELASEIK